MAAQGKEAEALAVDTVMEEKGEEDGPEDQPDILMEVQGQAS